MPRPRPSTPRFCRAAALWPCIRSLTLTHPGSSRSLVLQAVSSWNLLVLCRPGPSGCSRLLASPPPPPPAALTARAPTRTAGSSACSVCAGGQFSYNAGLHPPTPPTLILRNGETRCGARAAGALGRRPRRQGLILTLVVVQAPQPAPPARPGPTPAPRVGMLRPAFPVGSGEKGATASLALTHLRVHYRKLSRP